MENIWEQIQLAFTTYLPNLLLAIAVLIIGWLLALIISSIVRNLLKRTNLDERLANTLTGDMTAEDVSDSDRISLEKWISTAVFWLIMIFTLIVFFQVLDIPAISGPLGDFSGQIVSYIPGIIGAAVLLLIAWIVATILRALVVRVVNATGLARRLSAATDTEAPVRTNISRTIGNVVYWLVFLFFLPAVLHALNLEGILAPVQGLVDEILAFLPNLLAAIVIGVVGWIVARIIRQIVTNLLAGIGIDRFGARAGEEVGDTDRGFRLSSLIGTIVYVLILIPVAIAALNALDIPAVSQPAALMLTNLLNALPAIFGAFLLIGIAYFVARVVGGFVASILNNIGFDRLFQWLGLYLDPRRETPAPPTLRRGIADTGTSAEMAERGMGPEDVAPGRTTPSKVVGYLVTIAIVLFAVMEGANLLGFEELGVLVSGLIVAGARVLVGLIIFGIGLYLSYLAARVIRDSGTSQAHILAPAARIGIIIFSAALALREMGIAESIVNLAFGLLLGAVAVAAALAFGLGGREAAARQLERWRQQYKEAEARIPATGSSEEPMSSSPENPKEQYGSQEFDTSGKGEEPSGM